MITDIQLDSLAQAVREGRVKITQVPKELKVEVEKRLKDSNEK